MLTKEGLDTSAAQLKLLEDYVGSVLREGQDYGVIPGTGSKPTLLKPGAANVIAAFNCYPDPHIETETIDLEKGLVFYRVRVDVLRMDDGRRRATGQGSCSSYEKKYRYRNALPFCPECNKENIRVSQGGGFYCWRKTGGCGASYQHEDTRITTQPIGQVLSDDPMEQANTILKMAVKRGEVDAALRLPGVARFFTQDLEDMHPGTEPETVEPQTAPARPSSRAVQPQRRAIPPVAADPAICSVVGHNRIRMGLDSQERRCHKLRDGTFCYGVAAEAPPEPEGGPPESEAPTFDDTPLGHLQYDIAQTEMEWPFFEANVLHLTWPEWIKLNGTVETARKRWENWRLQQAAKEA
jgi:hypothetical protein